MKTAAQYACALSSASLLTQAAQRQQIDQKKIPAVHKSKVKVEFWRGFSTAKFFDILPRTFPRASHCETAPSRCPREVSLTPAEFMQRLRKGERLAEGQKLKGLLGRVMYGKGASCFQWVARHDMQTTPWTFAVASDGLQEIIGKDSLQILLTFGLEPLYIHKRLEDGFSFALVVFKTDDVEAVPGTWDGYEHCLRSSGTPVAALVCSHIDVIKNKSFSELERLYDNHYQSDGAMRSAMSDPSNTAYMSPKKLLQLGDNATPEDVRAHLLHHWNVGPLFKGTGKTRGSDEILPCEEVFIRNFELDKVEHAMMPLGTPPMNLMVEKLRDGCNKFQEKLAVENPKVRTVTPSEYMSLLHAGKPLMPNEELQGVCGRVIAGTSPTHYNFVTVGGFCTGPDGLAALVGKQPMDILLMCGFDELDIYDKVKQGCSFGLVVLPVIEGDAFRASWKGFEDFIHKTYPSISHLMSKHISRLREERFPKLDEEYFEKHKMSMAAAGRDPELRMTAERLESLGNCAAACDVRAFLHHMLGCNHLFRGDGYAMTPSGMLTFTEYILLPRRSREELDQLGAAFTVIGTPPLGKCIEKVCQRYGNLLEKMDMFDML